MTEIVPHPGARAGFGLAVLGMLSLYVFLDTRRLETYGSDLAIWQDAVKWQSDDPVIRNGLGKALAGHDQLEDAADQFRAAVELEPKYVDALYNYGTALNRLGRPQQALEQFDHALAMQPRDPILHNNAGNALLKLGELTAAVKQYERAIELQPDYARAYFNLAIVSARLNRSAEAIRAAETALRLAKAKQSFHLASDIEGWIAENRGGSPQ